MTTRPTFNEREQQATNPPSLQQNEISATCRVQIMDVLINGLQAPQQPDPYMPLPPANVWWNQIAHRAAVGLGRIRLHPSVRDPLVACGEQVLNAPRPEVLTIVECALQVVDTDLRNLDYSTKQMYNYTRSADDVLAGVNARLQQHGVGYEYRNGQIVSIDSRYIHSQVEDPAFMLLQEPQFQGPLTEFLRAHDHYCHSRYESAVNDAENAVESVIKSICMLRMWVYAPTASAQPLIKVLTDNGLLPSWFESVLLALPTLRNKSATAHGAGPQSAPVPRERAAYALHLAAADIVFLIETHKAHP